MNFQVRVPDNHFKMLKPYFKKLAFERCIVETFQEDRGVDFKVCLIRSQASGGNDTD